jgi:hypothetical protein
MSTFDRLEAALKRLAAALDQLEAVAERRVKADALRAHLEEQLAVMQGDRSRLAAELEGAVARSSALESANEEVARKLTSASAAVRAVLTAVDASEASA